MADLRDLENARLDALQVALCDAVIDGDVSAAVAVVKIVQARVHLNGLEPARDSMQGVPLIPRTLVVPQPLDLTVLQALSRNAPVSAEPGCRDRSRLLGLDQRGRTTRVVPAVT